MQTLKIEIPNGYEIDFDKAVGEIKFKEKPKNVMERINSDEDVLTDNGLTWEQFNQQCFGLPEDEVAYRFLKLLVKSLNPKGWVADFDNTDQVKYEPRFVGGSSGFRFHGCDHWRTFSYVGSRLCLESSELAVHAGTKFTRWYKQIIIIK